MFLFMVLICFVAFGAFCFAQQSAEQLFQSAIYEEEVGGDLEKAIALYNQVLDAATDENLAAKAQLQIGICYEKLGKTEAIKAYEQVLEKYAGQKEQAAMARSRLAELKKDAPKGFTVTEADFYMAEPFEMSPDGTKIVGVALDKGQNIVISNLETGQRDYITNFDWGGETYWSYNPVWSPDGKEISYLASYSGKPDKNDHQLCVSTLDGQTRILIRSQAEWFTPYAWMPDGTAILTVKGDKDNNQELGLVPSKGGEFEKLVSLQGNVESYGRSRPGACVSPDGRFIVYRDRPFDEDPDLFIMTSDGKSPRPLCPHPAVDRTPRWSPDGKHIVFLSDRGGNLDLWGVAIDNGKPGDPFLIREGMGNNMFGNWTQHGLISWNWVRMRDIFLLDVDPKTGEPAGKPKQIDYTPTGSNSLPAFAPDGRLTFRSGGARSLVITDGEGGNAQEYKLPKGLPGPPRTIEWMPDGSGIGIYCRTGSADNFLVQFSFTTGTLQTYPISNENESTTLDWAGSGRAYYYGKNGFIEDGAGIIEHNIETGEERTVYKPNEGDEGTRVWFTSLNSSRDYKKIAFFESRSKLVVVDVETGESSVLLQRNFSNTIFPSWSPDGQRIMACGALPGEGGNYLFVVSLNTGTVDQFDLSGDLPKDSRIAQAKWSPDGTKVAFVLQQNKSEHLIYTNIIPEDKR